MMVFARSKTRLRNLPTFKFGNLDLDLVDEASKAMYSLIQKGRRLKLPTDIMLKVKCGVMKIPIALKK